VIHRPDRDRSSRKGQQYGRQASSEARQNSSSSSGASPPHGREVSYPQILPSDRQRSALVKRKGKTDPTYGLPPEQRSLKQHISLGAINLDKTSGPTSHEVAAWVKRILEVDKAGHSGTLDPKVTGILPVLLEDATRIMETLLLAGKEYICLMRLHKPLPNKRIMEVCREIMAPLNQQPPLKSSVVKELRIRTIYYLDVLEIDEQHVLMRVGCEAGTYIRKLCFDMGLALGCGANMEELRRTRAGPFREDKTLVTLHNLTDAVAAWKEKGHETALRRSIQPVEAALAHLPRLVIADNAVDAVCHGAPLAAPGLLSLETDINKGDMVSFFTLKGEAVAVGVAQMESREMLASQSGIVARTERVIMQPNTYPKAWKLSERDAATAAGNAAKK